MLLVIQKDHTLNFDMLLWYYICGFFLFFLKLPYFFFSFCNVPEGYHNS